MESLRSDTMRMVDLRRNLKIAISLVYYFVRECLFVAWAAGPSAAQRLTIIYYHGVTRSCRSSFARQMQALHRDAPSCPHRTEANCRSATENVVAITFDDAFVSVAENALPELDKYSSHCTIFVPVGWLGRTPGWRIETTGLAGRGARTVRSRYVVRAVARSKPRFGLACVAHRDPPVVAGPGTGAGARGS